MDLQGIPMTDLSTVVNDAVLGYGRRNNTKNSRNKFASI